MTNEDVPSSLRVLLVDDHQHVRSGVRSLLEDEEFIEVIGEADCGESGLLKAATLLPDLVIMDVNMPRMDGLEATKRLKALHPQIAVIILTVNDEELFLLEAIKAGASSYVLKDSISEQLVQSVQVVADGGSLIPLHLLQKAMVKTDSESEPPIPTKHQLTEPLTDKEMEVLVRIVQGMKNQEIADELHVAKVTVKKRVQCIFQKMMVSDRTQAALKAVKLKLVDL